MGRALPGWAIDLATDGVRGQSITRRDVVTATRRVMLSAHRSGWRWTEVHVLLTDTRRRLAVQIATGKGGRTITVRTRETFLRRHWHETAKVAARPAWDRRDALGFIEVVQDALDTADLPERDRDVMQTVLDLANQHGTTRPAVPERVIADRTGLSASTARRVLARLAADGQWLTLAQRGNHRTRRANLYALAPALAGTYGGATPPEHQPVPMHHVPMHHPEETDMDGVLTTRMTPEEHAAVLALLAKMRGGDQQEQSDADVRHLRTVGGREHA